MKSLTAPTLYSWHNSFIMKILIACEFSGKIRSRMRMLGHHAISCDLERSADNSPYHVIGDVLEILYDGWDMMIAHPPCTHLAVSGSKHFARKRESGEQQAALEFARTLWNAPINRICLENPSSILATQMAKTSQVICPSQFGHIEKKRTCLWLKNLPKLVPTQVVYPWLGSTTLAHAPSATRGKDRSVTYSGIAEAMANQWGSLEAIE